MRELKFADLDLALQKIKDYRLNGVPRGLSCGWPNMDNYMTLIPGQLIVASGYPSSGKSEFVENIACHMATKNGWNVVMYSPESYPAERHTMNLAEKISGKSMVIKGKSLTQADDEDLYRALFQIKKRIKIISADEDPYSMDEILLGLTNMDSRGERVDMLVIDPFNELDVTRPNGQSETDWIGETLMRCRRVARKLGICFWIVAHPAKPAKKNDKGQYDPPDLYDLAGSAHWRNKCDNGIIVHRPNIENTEVEVHIKKIKIRYYGKPGKIYFEFQPNSARYIPVWKDVF